MSFGGRIKERREQLGMTRRNLADLMGITASAVANYENEISSPKAELLYPLMEALQCDANYLYQDETRALGGYPVSLEYEEHEHIKKYRSLDPYGKEAVDGILDVESRRCEAERQEQKGEDTPDPNDKLNDEEKDFMSYVRQLNHGQQEMLLEHLQQLIVQQRFSPTASTQA